MDALIAVVQRWLLFSGVLLLTGTVAWRGRSLTRSKIRAAGPHPGFGKRTGRAGKGSGP